MPTPTPSPEQKELPAKPGTIAYIRQQLKQEHLENLRDWENYIRNWHREPYWSESDTDSLIDFIKELLDLSDQKES